MIAGCRREMSFTYPERVRRLIDLPERDQWHLALWIYRPGKARRSRRPPRDEPELIERQRTAGHRRPRAPRRSAPRRCARRSPPRSGQPGSSAARRRAVAPRRRRGRVAPGRRRCGYWRGSTNSLFKFSVSGASPGASATTPAISPSTPHHRLRCVLGRPRGRRAISAINSGS